MRRLSISTTKHLPPRPLSHSHSHSHRFLTSIRPDPLSSNSESVNHSYLVPLAKLHKRPPNEAQFIHYITVCAKAGALREATQLFDKMPDLKCTPTVASLNQLLSLLCEKSEGLYMVRDVLLKSQRMGIRVDRSTFRILIDALCRNAKAKFAIEIMGLMGLFECDPDPRMYSLVLKSLCENSNSWSDVIAFIREMGNAGFSARIWDCHMVIDFLVKEGKVDEAYCFVNEMKDDGTKPDVNCYNKVLSGFCESGKSDMVDKVFDEMLINGLVPNICTFEIYISGLAKKGDVDEMVKMVKCMERTGFNATVQIYNMVIGEYMRSGEICRARELMDEMVRKGIKWNSDTLSRYYEKEIS
jgi:pentatricopeptide repeat protein